MNEFEAHQRKMAARLGYGSDVAAMNADHDPLHLSLCAWLGVESVAITTDGDRSRYEEDAVLSVQRFMRYLGVGVPVVRK